MILVSSHLDRVMANFSLKFEKGQHIGLLDNFAGVLLSYLAVYDDPMLLSFERRGKLKLWHNQGEEWGVLVNPPKLKRSDVVVNVDVWCIPAGVKCDFSLDNIYGFSDKEIKGIQEHLEWEGFNVFTQKYNGHEDNHDESYEWRKLVRRGMTFSIPISAPDDGWHRIQQDSKTSAGVMLKCRQGLKRLIGGPLCGYLE